MTDKRPHKLYAHDKLLAVKCNVDDFSSGVNFLNVFKASKLIADQTQMIAMLRSKITQLSTRCTDLYKANLNLEEINQQHKKLNGELNVELSSLKPKGIKLSYDTNQPEKETTVFGTKV